MSDNSTQTSSASVPAWMVTFADLMALMMTFFVLLYSFSKVDEERYRSVVDSMAQGFDGVQWIKRQLFRDDIIGPEPGVISIPPVQIMPQIKASETDKQADSTIIEKGTEPQQPSESNRLYSEFELDLEQEIADQLVQIENRDNSIIIRFPENVSFRSGDDKLVDAIIPTIHRIAFHLRDPEWRLNIAGHTDDRPISTSRFRSNWQLSASRAVSVAHTLLETGIIDSSQLTVRGHADTRPLVENDSKNNRAINRRVEIIITRKDIEPMTEKLCGNKLCLP